MIFLLALALVPLSPERVTWADVTEINHVYSCKGEHQFTQIIGWNDGAVDWWRIPTITPTPRRVGNRWHTVFHDKRGNVLRRVVSLSVWHSWTQYDREVEDRQLLPPEQRKGLP